MNVFDAIGGFFGKAARAAQGGGGTMKVTPEESPFLGMMRDAGQAITAPLAYGEELRQRPTAPFPGWGFKAPETTTPGAQPVTAESPTQGSPAALPTPSSTGGFRAIPALSAETQSILDRHRQAVDTGELPAANANYDVTANTLAEGPGFKLSPKAKPGDVISYRDPETGRTTITNDPSAPQMPPGTDANKFLDDLAEKIQNNPGMKTATGGMTNQAATVLAQIATAKAHLAGTGMTTEAAKEGHRVAAQANFDFRTASLEEKKRQNDLLASQHALAREAQKDIAAQKHVDTLVKNHAEYDANPENAGEKGMNMFKTYFNLWDAGVKVPEEMAGPIKQMGERYRAYRSGITENGKPKTTFTPEEEQMVKTRFRRTLSMYPETKK